jgi:hypothetical protein
VDFDRRWRKEVLLLCLCACSPGSMSARLSVGPGNVWSLLRGLGAKTEGVGSGGSGMQIVETTGMGDRGVAAGGRLRAVMRTTEGMTVTGDGGESWHCG